MSGSGGGASQGSPSLNKAALIAQIAARLERERTLNDELERRVEEREAEVSAAHLPTLNTRAEESS